MHYALAASRNRSIICFDNLLDSTHKHTGNKYCKYEESTCIHGNRESKTVLALLRCFLKDIANEELISYEDIYSNMHKGQMTVIRTKIFSPSQRREAPFRA